MSIGLDLVLDATARVCADAIGGTVFAAGDTAAITGVQPLVVPVADDWSEVGYPIVTAVLGTWGSKRQSMVERLHIAIECAVWRERSPLGETHAALLGDLNAIRAELLLHDKLHVPHAALQWAMLEGGAAFRPVSVPTGQTARMLLSAPFTVNVVTEEPAPNPID